MKKKSVAREILEWVAYISAAIAISLLITTFVGQKAVVYGHSMEPTLHDGNQLWIDKITPKLGNLHRGDIVTIYVPEIVGEEKESIIKRVIGIEGDHIQIKDGKVYVNGKAISEDYTSCKVTDPGDNPENNDLVVPPDHIYVLGDNRNPAASRDSRSIGPVAIDKVIGKAAIRIYPFKEFGLLRD